MTNTKRGGEGPTTSSLYLLENMELFLWPTMQICEKESIMDIKEMGSVQKGPHHKHHCGKTGRVYSATRHGAGTVVNKQGQDSRQEN